MTPDPSLVYAIEGRESGHDPIARGSSGELGSMQLMPAAVKHLGITDPFDIEQSRAGGAEWLGEELDAFNGDERFAVAAYNWGRPNVLKAMARAVKVTGKNDFVSTYPFLRPITQNYVAGVLSDYDQMKASKAYQNAQQSGKDEGGSAEDTDLPQSAAPLVDGRYGTVPEFATELQDLIASKDFESLSPVHKIKRLEEIYNSRQWTSEVDDVLKKSAAVVWSNATEEQRPDISSLIQSPLAQISGNNRKEIQQNGEAIQKGLYRQMYEAGRNPALFGNLIDEAFKNYTDEEATRIETKNRGVIGEAGVIAKEAVRGVGEAVTGTLALPVNLLGYEESARYIEDIPKSLLGEHREMDFEVDADGRYVLDAQGQPITRWRGSIIRGIGQAVGLLGGGAAIKASLAGAGYAAEEAAATTRLLMGGVGAAMGGNIAYTTTREMGGTREQALLASFVAMPATQAAAWLDSTIIAGDAKWIAGLTGENRLRAMTQFGLKAAATGGVAGAGFELGTQFGESVGLGKNVYSAERLKAAAAIGGVVGGAFGAVEGAGYKPPPKVEPPPPPPPTLAAGGLKEVVVTPRWKERPIGLPQETNAPFTKSYQEGLNDLARKVDAFDNDPTSMNLLIDVDPTIDVPQDLRDAFPGMTIDKIAPGKMVLFKKNSYEFPDIDYKNLDQVNSEIESIAKELESLPVPGTMSELVQRYQNLKNIRNELIEEGKGYKPEEARTLAKERTRLKEEIRQNKIDATKTVENSWASKYHAEEGLRLKNLLAEVEEKIRSNPAKAKAVEVEAEMADLSGRLTKMGPLTYKYDYQAKQQRLEKALSARAKLVPKEEGIVNVDDFINGALKVKTETGDKYVLPYKGKWHVTDIGARVSGHAYDYVGHAIHAARGVAGHTGTGQPIIVRAGIREAYPKTPAKKMRFAETNPGKPLVEPFSGRPKEEPVTPKGKSKGKSRVSKSSTTLQDESVTQSSMTAAPVVLAAENVPSDEVTQSALKTSSYSQGLIRPKTNMKPLSAEYSAEPPLPRTGHAPISAKEGQGFIKRLIKSLGGEVNVATGGKFRGGQIGYTKPYKFLSRIAIDNDLPTWMHEAVHLLDRAMLSIGDGLNPEGRYSKVDRKVQDALADTALSRYQDKDLPYKSRNTQISEGLATFAEDYITRQPTHRVVREWFHGQFAKEFPKQYKIIQDMKAFADRYYNQDPWAVSRGMRSAEHPGLGSGLLWQVRNAVNNWINRAAPLRALTKATGGLSRASEIKELYQHSAPEVARALLTGDSIFDPRTSEPILQLAGLRTVGRILRDASNLGKENYEKFLDYLVNKHLQVRYKNEGLESGINIPDMDFIVHEIETKYPDIKKLADEFFPSWHETVGAAVKGSTAGEAWFNNLTKVNRELTKSAENPDGVAHGFYVPIAREGAGSAKLGTRVSGSAERFFSPEKQLGRMMESIVANAHDGRALQEVLKYIGDYAMDDTGAYLLDTNGKPIINHLPTGAFGNEITNHEKLLALKKEYLARAKEVAGKEVESRDIKELDESFAPATAGLMKDLVQSSVGFLNKQMTSVKAAKGFRVIAWETPDGVRFFEVANNIANVFSYKVPDIIRNPVYQALVYTPQRVVKAGATALRPQFALMNNIAVDLPNLVLRGPSINPIIILHALQRSIFDLVGTNLGIKNTKSLVQSMQRLGINAAATRYSDLTLVGLKEAGWKPATLVDRTAGGIIRTIEKLFAIGEQLPRTAAAYERMWQLNIKDVDAGLNEWQAMEIAHAYLSVTNNYGIQGSYARNIATAVPFFSAHIAATTQSLEAVTKTPYRHAALLGSILGYGIMRAVQDRDSDWNKRVEFPDKMRFIHFPIETAEGRRLLAIKVEGPSQALWGLGQYIGSQMVDQGLWKAKGLDLIDQLAKEFMPLNLSVENPKDFAVGLAQLGGPVVSELIQQAANRTPYFARDIVPKGLAERPMSDQKTEYTSVFAQEIAKIVGEFVPQLASPLRWDHAIHSSSAVLADAIQVTEKMTGLKVDPGDLNPTLLSSLRNIYLRNGLVSNIQTKPLRIFYDKLAEFTANEPGETPEEKTARGKLTKIKDGLTAVSVMLGLKPPAEEREALYKTRSALLDAGMEIIQGKTTTTVPTAPIAQAKTAKKRQKLVEKAKAQKEQTSEDTPFVTE